MGAGVSRLLSIAGPPLAPGPPLWDGVDPRWPAALSELLAGRNGFYAFESALHVFPAALAAAAPTLAEWNAPALWRELYGDLAEGRCFFAEDVFGGQFALGPAGEVQTFDPETGALAHLADDIEGWASAILVDYRVLTGHPLAQEWQTRHGALVPGERLVPRQPFVLGGEFAVSNLLAMEAARGMRVRAGLASQIRDLPDGAQISFTIVD